MINVDLSPVGQQQFIDHTGSPLAGGHVYTYAAGTSTPLATYADAAGTVANPNPIILDASGRASIWLGMAPYKLVIQDALGNSVYSSDNVTSAMGLISATFFGANGSSSVGFIQAGSAAIQSTSQSKMRERFSLNDFGSTGFTAMSAAVNALKTAGGGSLKMPNGTQNTPVPGNYWNGVLQPGDIGGVLIDYDGPNVPVSMFLEQYGTSYLSQKVFRFYDNQAHAGFGHSAVHIENSAYGTGNIGPTNADFGLSISLKKLNANSGSARAGELDGAYIAVRNDGSNSDTTALLIDVGNYGVGFNAAFEANISYFYGGFTNLQMDVQCGVIDSRTNNQYGLVLAAQVGTLGYGILFNSLAGSNWTNFIVGAHNQINTYQLKSNGNTYLTTLDGTRNISFGIDPSSANFFINVASDSLRIFSLDQSGNLSLGGFLNVGGTNIVGAFATTATAGAASLPGNPVGFMTISRNGTIYKIPYYNN